MDHQQDFSLGLSRLDVNDPSVNPFIDGTGTKIYGVNNAYIKRTTLDGPQKPMDVLNQSIMGSSTNVASPAVKEPVQLHHPAAASAIQSTTNMTLWMQKYHPDLLVQMARECGHLNLEPLPPSVRLQVPGVPTNFVAPPVPMARHYGNITKKLKHWNLQMTQQMIQANEQLATANQRFRSAQDEISDLKYRLIMQEAYQSRQNRRSSTSEQSYATSPSYGKSQKRFTVRPYQPAMISRSPTKNVSPTPTIDTARTPTRICRPPNPKQSASQHHHRTGAPEQRQLRARNQESLYTLGTDPLTDRGLLCDFFDSIKSWAANYTISLQSLSTEQIHNLATHPALVGSLCPSLQFTVLVMEKDMLISIVASIVSHFIFSHTIDDHALHISLHPNASLTELVADQILSTTNPDIIKQLLTNQRDVYTAINMAPDHISWRTTCAQSLTADLLVSLSGLLFASPSLQALTERTHAIQELFVMGYTIGFRLHMAATRWRFRWPVAGAAFEPETMVNESRLLYGTAAQTMVQVGESPEEHVVRFAISPTVWSEGDNGEIVHSALVEVARRGL